MKKIISLFVFLTLFFTQSLPAIPLTWSDNPTMIVDEMVDVIAPIAVAPDGGAIVVWIDGSSIIRGSIYDATTEMWSTPENVTIGSSFSTSPCGSRRIYR